LPSKLSQLLLCERLLQSGAKSAWKLKAGFISHQPNHVPGSVDHSGAMRAALEMLGDPLFQNGIEVSVNIVRDLSPDLNATDLDYRHGQNGLTFL
jgi:hypothetical protein